MSDLIEDHLARTSRTFALAIPALDPRLRHAVGLAYLIFRVADTLEDAARWSAISTARKASTPPCPTTG